MSAAAESTSPTRFPRGLPSEQARFFPRIDVPPEVPPTFRRLPHAADAVASAGASAASAIGAIAVGRELVIPAPPAVAYRPRKWLLALLRSLIGAGSRVLTFPALAFAVVFAYFAIRAATQVVPEGDSALHLDLMQTVAHGKLPTTLPYFAASVAPGGKIEAFFPYSYPPLYHLIGGLVYKLGGVHGVLVMGPFFAGVIAVAIAFLLKPLPRAIAALAIVLALGQWVTQPTMTWIYMEPMMLGFFFVGLCFCQRLWTDPKTRTAAIAGLFFGLALATRQNVLTYLPIVAVQGAIMLYVGAEPAERVRDRREMLRMYAIMFGVAGLVAFPFILYQVINTGVIGYATLSVRILPGAAPIDPEASSYLNSISSGGSTLAWLDRFWDLTLFTSRWQRELLTFVPIVPFGAGVVYLWSRGGLAGRFLSSYAVTHLLGEMLLFMTLHGNSRYIIASRVLFYVVVAVGLWAFISWLYRAARDGATWSPRLTGAVAASFTIAVMVPGFVTSGVIDQIVHQEEGRAEKGRAFEELGAFVDQYVEKDALILSGRWYSSGYYFQRNYTWVTYFGNAWVIDAINESDPERARSVLDEYGIDYVLIQAPPPTYVDRMPSDGLRLVVLSDLDHFQLIFHNDRTRLYRFWPEGMAGVNE